MNWSVSALFMPTSECLCDMKSFVAIPLGFEPRIYGFVDDRLIHWAIGPDKTQK